MRKPNGSVKIILFLTCLISCFIFVRSQATQARCGADFGGFICNNPEEPCCSNHGFCGNSSEYCSSNCQSGCWPSPQPPPPPSIGGSTTPVFNSDHVWIIIVGCFVIIVIIVVMLFKVCTHKDTRWNCIFNKG